MLQNRPSLTFESRFELFDFLLYEIVFGVMGHLMILMT